MPRKAKISYLIPIKTVSESNLRQHWAVRAKRAKEQKDLARLITKMQPINSLLPPKRCLEITLIRIGKRFLDSDNLAASQKAIRDGIADALGIDDGSALLRWAYGQMKANDRFTLGTLVTLEAI